MDAILECALQSWQPKIGDPGVMGWAIVVLYALTGLLAFRTARYGLFPYMSARRERFFWCIIGLILLVLAVNKQLDLQSFLTASARCMAQIQGWYEDRRVVQIGVISGFLLVLLIGILGIWTLLRGTLRRNGLALLGLFFVLAFVGVRAVGFHQMDALINLQLRSIRLNWILEVTGPIMILLCGLMIQRAAILRQRTLQ